MAQHAAQNAVGTGCGGIGHLEHLRVAAKVGEARIRRRWSREVVEGLTAKRAVQVKVEHKLKVVPGMGGSSSLMMLKAKRVSLERV